MLSGFELYSRWVPLLEESYDDLNYYYWLFHDTMDNEISVQTDNASLVPYVQSKDGTNDETTYERRTMRDISRGQNKKKDGHKYVLVVKFMGL